MKPTRNIVKPNNNLWKTKGSVWYQKNDDCPKRYIKQHIKILTENDEEKPTKKDKEWMIEDARLTWREIQESK